MTDLLADTSALARLLRSGTAVERWRPQLDAGVIATCAVVELELLWSARGAVDRKSILSQLRETFSWVVVPDQVFERALDVQDLLSQRGQHRSAGAVDLVVAATAELSKLTLLHYDGDFEQVAAVTGQPTRWLAEPGSID